MAIRPLPFPAKFCRAMAKIHDLSVALSKFFRGLGLKCFFQRRAFLKAMLSGSFAAAICPRKNEKAKGSRRYFRIERRYFYGPHAPLQRRWGKRLALLKRASQRQNNGECFTETGLSGRERAPRPFRQFCGKRRGACTGENFASRRGVWKQATAADVSPEGRTA